MPNNNKRKSRPKSQPRPAKTGPRPQGQPKSSVPRALVSRVCGLTDPFCEHANGAKYPDDSRTRTLAYSRRSRGSISSLPDGTGAFLFYPIYDFQGVSYPATSSGDQVLTWTNFPATSYIGNASSYRIVSWGVRFRNITAPLSSSGMVHLRGWGNIEGASFDGVSTRSYNASSALDTPLQDAKDIVYVGEHTSQMPQAFYSVNSDAANVAGNTAHGFNGLTVYLAGVPASVDVLDYEMVVHFELVFETSDGLGQAATPAPPANPLITAGANYVSSSAKSMFQYGIERVSKHLTDVATAALLRATPQGRFAGAMLALN